MPDPDGSGAARGPAVPAGETDWERRRRRARVFGVSEPDTTADERDPAAVAGSGPDGVGEAWLRDQVPPHHGG